MARRRKRKPVEGWEGWGDKVEVVDKLPSLGPTDQAPLTVAELEAKGFKGEDVEEYRKRSPFRKEFERRRKKEPLTEGEIAEQKEKVDPFREVGSSPVSGSGLLTTFPTEKKQKDFRRTQDKPRSAAVTDRTPEFSKALKSASPADEKIANLYIAEIKKNPTARSPTVDGLTIQEQPRAKEVQALVSRYTNSLEYAKSTTETPSTTDRTKPLVTTPSAAVEQEELPRVVDPEKPVRERKGTLSQDNFNPLDVKFVEGGVANQHAVQDANGEPLRDKHGHLIFPNAKAGWAGGRADVEAKISGNNQHGLTADSTLASFGQVYALDPEWANKVAQMLGVDTSIAVGELPVDDFIEKMAHQEGWYKGREDQAEKFAEGAEDELSPTIDPKKKKPMVRPTTPFTPAEPQTTDTIQTLSRPADLPVDLEGMAPQVDRQYTHPASRAVAEEELPAEIELPEGSTKEREMRKFWKVTKEEGEDVVDEKAGFGGFLKKAGGAIKRKVTGDDRPDFIREPENEEVALEINLKEMFPNNPQRSQNRMARQIAQEHFLNTYLPDEYKETTTTEGGKTTHTRKVKGVIKNLSPSTFYDDDSGILYLTYKPRNILWNNQKVLEEQEQEQ